ncbi:DNA phosphorothioation system sulfurtransferase DndC [Paenibacillus guangzhouensis]|uniref:DNA phosphorothioation system sulfurtransferase DndC n=1 Tax=Paenibacillus guangzhouensis TaxID=1473112 RepID=UPI0012670573|nr:DNA phosphorothioation system sulfurtransferase DndC [Paenibacillus guangzhouensis]
MSTAFKINKEYLQEINERIQDLYLSDHIPWIVGYSGGKDSTATLQLVWNAIKTLPEEKRNHKAIHVISTDTLVEQPIVAAWVNNSLKKMRETAVAMGMPVTPHRLTPDVSNSFWVNLIGRGYPAPRPTFRWCTSRLKIDPSNKFTTDLVKDFGETILVLGTRKAESTRRAGTMNKYEKHRIREWLSPNGSLQNSWVFSPIEDWTSDDVWLYLMQHTNPWGISNKDLMAMYREATNDNECPLVVDTSTPSCGNSRFGCWVCTLVSSDKSMEAMIQNDDEKAWMEPLLKFRNEEIGMLNENGRIDDHDKRDFRRKGGAITLKRSGTDVTPGPYLKSHREHLLRRLLEVQEEVRELMPEDMEGLELIALEEIKEIQRIWVQDKAEFDDAVPKIYHEVTGAIWPFNDKYSSFGREEWSILEEITEGNHVTMDLFSSLLYMEEQHTTLRGRKAVLSEIEKHIKRCFYEDAQDALAFKQNQVALRDNANPDELASQLEMESEDDY